MADNSDQSSVTGRGFSRLAVRLVVVFAAVWIAKLGVDAIFAKVALFESDANARTMTGLLITIMLGYAILLAIPFMPGVEIGVAVLVLEGANAAPVVYGATVLGLLLAFCIGQYAPLPRLIKLCKDYSFVRIGRLLERICLTPREERLDAMQGKLPDWLAPILCHYRYVTLGLTLNLPGNVALGGGGGIMLVGGLSRLFQTGYIALTVAIATLPVPLGVWLWGTNFLQ